MISNFLKEILKLILIISIGLIISFIVTAITGAPFRWWITIGIFTGIYVGIRLFNKKN